MPRNPCLVALLALTFPALGPLEAGPPPAEFGEVVEALETAGLRHAVVGEDRDTALVGFATEHYRDLDDDSSVRILLTVVPRETQPWLVAQAFNLYSLVDCRHPEAARRVLMGANGKMGVWTSFDYDETDGTVTARMAWPLTGDRIDPEALNAMLREMAIAIDRVDPVLRRAMESGMVDWPSDDLGPKEPAGWIEVTGEDGQPLRVGWAVWAEQRSWASTLIAADPILREFSSWDDERRDRFGRILASEFGGSAARAMFVDWLRGSNYIEQHHPPVAVRFFGPEGTEVSVKARCPDYARGTAVANGTVDAMGHVDVEPMLNWDDRALRGLEMPTKATFQVELSCGGVSANAEASVEIQPVGMTELGLPATLPIAIYVNEAHPWVRDIVSEAGRLRVADSLGGDDDTSYSSAARQIHAVWRALRARDVKYVSIHQADAQIEGSQAIREFHDSVRDQGANCADGTAAIASILAAIGLDVHIVQLPGHVLVGVYLKNPGRDRNWIFLETTALGQDAAEPGQGYLDDVERDVPARFRDDEWNCFEAACSAGEKQVNEAQEGGEVLIASLRTLREKGLRCIPTSRTDVGSIPPVPDQKPIAARRAAAQAEANDRHARFLAWVDSLPNRDAVPYADTESVARDIEQVGTDPAAMGRLLRSVDGDGVGQRSLRALAALRDALMPMSEAALEVFGEPSPTAGALLGITPSASSVSLERAPDGRTKARILDRNGHSLTLLLLREEQGSMVIEGQFIEYSNSELCTKAAVMAYALRDDALHDSDGLASLGREMADRVRAREFKDQAGMLQSLQQVLHERYGREDAASGNP